MDSRESNAESSVEVGQPDAPMNVTTCPADGRPLRPTCQHDGTVECPRCRRVWDVYEVVLDE